MNIIEFAKFKKMAGGGGGCGATAYTAKSVDELPSDAPDGSLAIVESDSLKGKWEWKDNQSPLDFSMFGIPNDAEVYEQIVAQGNDNVAYLFTIFGFKKNANEGVNVYVELEEPIYIFLDGAFDDFYTTFEFYTEPNCTGNVYITYERFTAFLKTNCNRLSGGNSLYIRKNGEWVYEREAEMSEGGQNVPVYDGTQIFTFTDLVTTDSDFIIEVTVDSSCVIKDKLYFALPRQFFGDATSKDVKFGKQFFSANGLQEGEHQCESGGDVVLPCIIELFDQDYCGDFNVTYKAYENGSIVDRTAVVPCGDRISIVTIQGTEMFVSGAFSDIGFYDADGTPIESTSRFADGGIYYTIPAFMNCNAIIYG